MGIVRAVCTSPAKGTQKTNVKSAEFIEDFGIKEDAHAGKWHRQISLLSYEKIEAFRARGAEVADGAFGENLVVEGFDFKNLPVGTRFQCNEVILEMTQIGKECHHGCEIFRRWETASCQEKVYLQGSFTADGFPAGMRCTFWVKVSSNHFDTK